MIAAHHSGPCYPTIWERLALFGRKNKAKVKPQSVRKGKRRTKPPHRGGDSGKKKGGWF